MKKSLIFLIIGCIVFSVSASAQPGYLIKIDPANQTTIDQTVKTEIKVYAKTADFWVVGANQKDLDLLAKKGISFQVLDKEAGVGEYYFVWAKPFERIDLRQPELTLKSTILFIDADMALVKGNPKKIEELASSGFSIRKIERKPLPWETKEYLPTYIKSLSPGYDPLIDTLIHRVQPSKLLTWVDDLSGEDTVLIGGLVDSIKTRYSYSDGIFKAAHFLKEKFEEMGVNAEFDTVQFAPTEFFVDFACSPGGQKAWTVSLYGGIAKTTNGGDSWALVEGTGAFELNGICRVDDDTLWSVGEYGLIIRSTNGGDTWENRSKPEFSGLFFGTVYFEDANHGWVVGQRAILFTTDGGANWTQQAQLSSIIYYGIDFADPYHGWVVGQNGTILHTTNRGANWEPQISGTSDQLRAVDFVDTLNGWAVGSDGWAIYTTNGGLNWIQKTFPHSTVLTHVSFIDSLHGWMVGDDGTIFYTSDLGVNWITHSTNSISLRGINFADTLTGWATGYCGIIKTTDGGENWISQYQNLLPMKIPNVVATIEGRINPGRQVLMTGHYDDVSGDYYHWAPGADDNASGTASLLMAASIMKNYGWTNTVKFIAFAAEEQGLLGSASYAEEAYLRGDTILGVQNFDMIAWEHNGDNMIDVHSGNPPENQALADILIGTISDYGLNLAAQKITNGASDRSDQASFWNYNYPAILGIEDSHDLNPYYHGTGDRVSVFDTAYYVNFTKATVASLSILAYPFIVGDVNKDRVTDIGDVVYLINYLFKYGPTPDPLPAGDVTCDGVLDVGDIVYLINYLFKGGTAPNC